ncbi:MAG: metallophosphoesterase family protein [Candidatus Promineifilaceae bacterium]|nr:metallophosphoesterase family protein [Candidatus Promineifilaceae bacterium]
MQIAIFSDVHGNLTALEAVLDDIARREGLEQIIFAGDLCLGGPRPQECLNLVRQRRLPTVVGNTDEWVIQPPPIEANMDASERQKWEQVAAVSKWTRGQLDHESLAWLDENRTVPERRISPTVNPQDDLLVVHANPQDLNQIIFPPPAQQEELYGQVRQSDQELGLLLQGLVMGVLAFGHLHVPNLRRWQDLLLVNISSVSLPGDGDPRAKYAILTWDGGWSAEHIFVDYDWSAEAEAFRHRQPPGWEDAVRKIEEQGLIPQVV